MQNNLKRLREAAGLSQGKLAKLCDIPASRISNIECGVNAIGNIRLSSAVKIAKALGVPVEELYPGENE